MEYPRLSEVGQNAGYHPRGRVLCSPWKDHGPDIHMRHHQRIEDVFCEVARVVQQVFEA